MDPITTSSHVWSVRQGWSVVQKGGHAAQSTQGEELVSVSEKPDYSQELEIFY